MQQVRIHGPGDVRVDDVPEPDPGPRDAVVRVAACGICGSDLHYIHLGGLGGTGEPMCLGHEMAGTVERAGPEVTSARVGDRVVVRPGNDELGRIGNGAPQGGLAPLLLVTDADRRGLHHVPEGMPLDIAALAEPLGVGMRAVEQVDVAPGSGVCVFGCGPIGLAAIATLVDGGHHDVVAVDLNPTRRELAGVLGAQVAVDPAVDDIWAELARVHGTASSGRGPTPATGGYIEATGAGRVITDVVEHARVAAHLSIVALHLEPVPTSYLTILMKELTIRGSMEYPARFADTLDLLGRRDLAPMITHRFPLGDFDQALSTLETSKDCGKVQITFD